MGLGRLRAERLENLRTFRSMGMEHQYSPGRGNYRSLPSIKLAKESWAIAGKSPEQVASTTGWLFCVVQGSIWETPYRGPFSALPMALSKGPYLRGSNSPRVPLLLTPM